MANFDLDMCNPKLHHFVPQFYLKRFTNEENCLWVFDKNTNKIFTTSSESIAAETHFYRVPELIESEHDPIFLEKVFSELESDSSILFDQWSTKMELAKPSCDLEISMEEKQLFSMYVTYQYLRTAEQKEILSLFAEIHGNYPNGVSQEEKSNLHARLICDEKFVNIISDRIVNSIWIFGKNTTNTPFFTSDNPVLVKTSDNKKWLKATTGVSKNTYIVFPLSPSLILYCKDKSYCKGIEKFDMQLSPVEFDDEMVEHENSGQVFSATRFVISPDNNFSFAQEFLLMLKQNKTHLMLSIMVYMHFQITLKILDAIVR